MAVGDSSNEFSPNLSLEIAKFENSKYHPKIKLTDAFCRQRLILRQKKPH
jgi:hypothetical protein